MNAVRAVVDLDDTQGLIAADRDGLLRAASLAGAQVRATAAAVAEGALDSIRTDQRPRSVVWVAGRGSAESAGAVLAATLSGAAVEPIVLAAEAPPWIGPLDLVVVAGDDPADPTLVGAAAMAIRRGSRLVVVAPVEGPLREAAAGQSAALPPRLWVSDEFSFCRYLAAGLAVVQAVDATVSTDLDALADELDAEALHNSAAREVFTNAAKSLADRIAGRDVALVGDGAATLALARYGAALFLRVAGHPIAAAGLADALAALAAPAVTTPGVDALFHDEQIDGPAPAQLRVLALTLTAERPALAARLSGFPDVDMVGIQDVPDAEGTPATVAVGRPEQQLATLAVRLGMAAAYLRLVRG